MQTEDNKNQVEKLAGDVMDFLDARWDLLVLNFTERVSKAVALLTGILIMAFFGLLIILFLSLGLASWLNRVLNSPSAGYLITAAVMLILLLVVRILALGMVRAGILKKVIETLDHDNEQR